jgi:hypothetical protein
VCKCGQAYNAGVIQMWADVQMWAAYKCGRRANVGSIHMWADGRRANAGTCTTILFSLSFGIYRNM